MISVNFTNCAQFHKKRKTKRKFFSLCTFHEAYNIKLFNGSFLILWKIVFTEIIIFQISELNAYRDGKLLRKRTVLTHKISYKSSGIHWKKENLAHFFLMFQITPQAAHFSWDGDYARCSTSTFLNGITLNLILCLVLL